MVNRPRRAAVGRTVGRLLHRGQHRVGHWQNQLHLPPLRLGRRSAIVAHRGLHCRQIPGLIANLGSQRDLARGIQPKRRLAVVRAASRFVRGLDADQPPGWVAGYLAFDFQAFGLQQRIAADPMNHDLAIGRVPGGEFQMGRQCVDDDPQYPGPLL